MLTEIKNLGVADVCTVVCDSLKGLPDAINTVWELAVVQTCIIHLIRNTFRRAARQYWDKMARDLKPVYTAPSESAAKERSSNSAGSGVSDTQRSCGCGRTPGPSSFRSWITTSRSGG
ncbi:hypothetical protein JCM9803A_02520 [Rhodococcus erythropolis]